MQEITIDGLARQDGETCIEVEPTDVDGRPQMCMITM